MKKLFALLIASLFYIPAYTYAEPVTQPSFNSKPDILATVQVNGEISDDLAKTLKSKVDKINENTRVKAVLIVLNTPGGGVTASAQIRELLSTIKVPVVAWCDTECASGGMYILQSKAIKYIAVSDYTVAGSIGVYLEVTRYNRLLDWAKVDTQIYKSAPLKGAGDPTQPTDAAQDAYFQSIVGRLASQFYDLVITNRHITDLSAMKSAKVFIGEDAVKLGLADAVMTKEQAEKKAKELSGSKSIYTIEELKLMSKSVSGNDDLDSDDSENDKNTLPNEDLHWLTLQLQDMLGQENVQFKYELPYKF